MTAEQSDPQPAFAALEARVTRLEEYRQHVLPMELAATHNAVSLVYAGTDELRAKVGDLLNRVIQLGTDVHDGREAQIRHGGAMATLAGKVDGLAVIGGQNASALAQQGGQAEALQRDVAGVMGLQEEHGRLLAEILRRLPAPGE